MRFGPLRGFGECWNYRARAAAEQENCSEWYGAFVGGPYLVSIGATNGPLTVCPVRSGAGIYSMCLGSDGNASGVRDANAVRRCGFEVPQAFVGLVTPEDVDGADALAGRLLDGQREEHGPGADVGMLP